jgi:hypothetical protein
VKKKRHPRLVARDYQPLEFIWKWKLASTSTIWQRHWPNIKKISAYRRLYNLRLMGLVEPVYIPKTSQFVWSLTKKGFDVVRSDLPMLKESGFRSENPHHDLYASAFHLGDFLWGAPNSVEFVTEQELRRLDDTSFPGWVPLSEDHRPDGFLNIGCKDEDKIFAFEVELHPKSREAYRNVANTYGCMDSLNKVLWLVESETLAKQIDRSMSDAHFYDSSKGEFFIRSEFEHKCWGCRSVLGLSKGLPLRAIVSKSASKPCKSIAANFALDRSISS